MAKIKATSASESQPKRKRKPATTPEARENQLIAAAYDLAEKQIYEGTASSQVITHFLKLGSDKEKYKLELERLRSENKLAQAKAEKIESEKLSDEKYAEAIAAMRTYSGLGAVEYDKDLF